MTFYIIRSFFMFINIESLWVVYISIDIEHLETSKSEYHTLADLQNVIRELDWWCCEFLLTDEIIKNITGATMATLLFDTI